MLAHLATRFLWHKKRQGTCTTAKKGIAVAITFAAAWVTLAPTPTFAINPPTATISINDGAEIDAETLAPTTSEGASKVISVPVKTTFTYASTYTMGVGLDCSGFTGSKLTACQSGALVGAESGAKLAGTTNGSSATDMQTQNTSENSGGAWGYGVDKTGGATVPSSYNAVPVNSNTNNVINSTDTDSIKAINTTNTPVTKNVTLFFAAGVNQNQPSDTYTGNILVTVVAEPVVLLEWAIEYDLDGGSWSGADTGNQGNTASAGEESVTVNLRSVTPTKAAVGGTSYTFDGWKDVDSSAVYTANASVTLTLAKPTLRLKAQWKAVTSLVNNGKMQDATGTQCKNTAEGTTLYMYDGRDNKSYIVGKLKDGNCWMLQNLAINTGITLKSTDSDVSSNYTIPGTVGWSDNSTAYAKAQNSMHIDNTQDATAVNNNTNLNTGGYYSFLTATAGTGTGSSGNASSSICPKGWKLPTGGSGGQFQTLYNKYGNASSFNTAFKQAATGDCYSILCPGANSYAGYWSSTIYIYNASLGYSLYSDSSNVSPASYDSKSHGYSVRCILVAS